jgi:flagellar biosynthetic protein FlhB
LGSLSLKTGAAFFWMTMPFLLGLSIVGFAVSVSQVGFMFSTEALQPKTAKLNPLKGIKRIFASRRSMIELLKNLVKLIIVGLVTYFAISSVIDQTVLLMDSDVTSILEFFSESVVFIGSKAGIAFLGLALFDFVYQKSEFEKDLRMTKQEVKEESKMMEGDPLIKSRIRSVQKQIAYKRMMHEVPKADVIVTNPTHLAVALKYEPGTMDAPKVVAKGADLIAQKIKDIAKEHGIPIVEDKPLARALYKSVEIGQAIPEKLFQAVAQLLAYIYKMKHTTTRFAS